MKKFIFIIGLVIFVLGTILAFIFGSTINHPFLSGINQDRWRTLTITFLVVTIIGFVIGIVIAIIGLFSQNKKK